MLYDLLLILQTITLDMYQAFLDLIQFVLKAQKLHKAQFK